MKKRIIPFALAAIAVLCFAMAHITAVLPEERCVKKPQRGLINGSAQP